MRTLRKGETVYVIGFQCQILECVVFEASASDRVQIRCPIQTPTMPEGWNSVFRESCFPADELDRLLMEVAERMVQVRRARDEVQHLMRLYEEVGETC